MNNEWFEVNLPWCDDVFDIIDPKYPDAFVENAIIEKFGFSKEQLIADFENEYKKPAWQILDDAETFFEESLDLNKEFLDDQENDEEKENALKTLLSNYKDPLFLKAKEHMNLRKTMNDYEHNLPEVIEYRKTLEDSYNQRTQLQNERSFRYSPYNKVGTLIEVAIKQYDNYGKSNGEIKIKKFLIGDIAISGGISDEFSKFVDSDIILRAKVLINDEDLI